MAFTGNLNAVALTDIVQLVALAQKSCTLTVVTGRGRFTVLFRGGYVVDAYAVRLARTETDDGESRKELHVNANLSSDPSKGVSLEEMAGKIFRLSTGHFTLQSGEPQTDSKVALDISGLLLESFRQHDEEVRGGAAATNDYESLVGDKSERGSAPGTVLPVETVIAEPQRPNSPLLHLFTLFRILANDAGEQDRERVLLDAAREVFDRAILFRVAEKELCGVGGYSIGYTGEADRLDAMLALMRIPRGAHSPIQDAVDVKHISTGGATEEWWRNYVPVEFGPIPETEYVAVPVVAGGSCVMVLYGDTYLQREFADPLRALDMICKHVGVLMENEMLRHQRPGKSWRTRLSGTRHRLLSF